MSSNTCYGILGHTLFCGSLTEFFLSLSSCSLCLAVEQLDKTHPPVTSSYIYLKRTGCFNFGCCNGEYVYTQGCYLKNINIDNMCGIVDEKRKM